MLKPDKPIISEITPDLYISSEPTTNDLEVIVERNIGLVISMIGNHRPPKIFDQHPLQLLWLPTFDTILTPIPIRKLWLGVEKAMPVIQNDKGVLCYCAAGRHRSVAMGACILIAMGNTAEEAMKLLRSRRKIARPQTWHIRRRILQFEKLWPQRGERLVPPREGYAELATAAFYKLVWGLGVGREF